MPHQEAMDIKQKEICGFFGAPGERVLKILESKKVDLDVAAIAEYTLKVLVKLKRGMSQDPPAVDLEFIDESIVAIVRLMCTFLTKHAQRMSHKDFNFVIARLTRIAKGRRVRGYNVCWVNLYCYKSCSRLVRDRVKVHLKKTKLDPYAYLLTLLIIGESSIFKNAERKDERRHLENITLLAELLGLTDFWGDEVPPGNGGTESTKRALAISDTVGGLEKAVTDLVAWEMMRKKDRGLQEKLEPKVEALHTRIMKFSPKNRDERNRLNTCKASLDYVAKSNGISLRWK